MIDAGGLKRRTLAGLAAAAAVAPLAGRAQTRPTGPARVGFVYVGPRELAAPRVELIEAGLRSAGVQGEIETVLRLTEGNPNRLAPAIEEVLARNVSVFVAVGPAVLREVRKQTATVPIVAYDFESDPVTAGFVQSVARPGGNMTGIFLDVPAFVAKWLEFLRECLSRLSRVALAWEASSGRVQVEALTRTARDLGIATDLLEVGGRADYDSAFARAGTLGAGAVILLSSPLVFANIPEIAALSLKHRMPAITLFAEFARAGGLMAYGPSALGATRQAGFMAGRILRGQTPATMPIEQPSIYNLAINLRTAGQLGVAIPPTLLARADDVIE